MVLIQALDQHHRRQVLMRRKACVRPVECRVAVVAFVCRGSVAFGGKDENRRGGIG